MHDSGPIPAQSDSAHADGNSAKLAILCAAPLKRSFVPDTTHHGRHFAAVTRRNDAGFLDAKAKNNRQQADELITVETYKCKLVNSFMSESERRRVLYLISIEHGKLRDKGSERTLFK